MLPSSINEALTYSDSKRGSCKVGVTYRAERPRPYVAGIVKTIDGKRKKTELGHYATEEEAFLVYKYEKEKYIRSLAEANKHQLEPKVYHALIGYEVMEDF